MGGNTNYAHGWFPICAVLHRQNGVEDVHELAIRDLCERTGYSVGEDVMRTCVYGRGEFFDWLYTFRMPLCAAVPLCRGYLPEGNAGA